MIRIAVVDQEKATLDYVAKVIEAEPDLELVGSGASGAEAVQLATELSPEVLILDLPLSDADEEDVTRTITGEGAQHTAILARTDPGSDDLGVSAIRAGASGICTKTDPTDALVCAVRTVATGDAVISRSLLRRLLDRIVPIDRTSLRSCSPREVEVLSLTANGATNPEIAEKLIISETTVRTHVQNLRLKLGARNRVDLVVLGHKSGLADSTITATDQEGAPAMKRSARMDDPRK